MEVGVKRAILVGLMILLTAPSMVSADTITYWRGEFTSDHMTSGAGSAPYGEVILTVVDADKDGAFDDVHFDVNLYSGSQFVRTGAGKNYNFLLNGYGVSKTDFILSGLTVGSVNYDFGSVGYFTFGVFLSDQCKGGGNGMPGPLSFNIINVSILELIGENNQGNIFAADILSGQTGNTGLVDVSQKKVPEPGTLLFLGLGLFALTFMRRLLKRKLPKYSTGNIFSN
jgi:hypothetical protein